MNTVSYEVRLSTSTIVMICLALVGGLAIVNHLVQSASSEKKSAAVETPQFTVNPQLSIPQLYTLGGNCNSDGDMVCARAVFKRILELNPNDLVALANLGMAESKSGHHEQALPLYEIYFNRGGNGYDTMAYYAGSLNAVGDKAQALNWYMRVLKSNPRLVDVAESVTSLLIEMDQPERAAQFLDGFVKKNPGARSYFQETRERLRESKVKKMESSI